MPRLFYYFHLDCGRSHSLRVLIWSQVDASALPFTYYCHQANCKPIRFAFGLNVGPSDRCSSQAADEVLRLARLCTQLGLCLHFLRSATRPNTKPPSV